mmetsp:Transcript_17229/g.24255  ORF Transcript_17229/g.24255 Transcript_17229/m.24255 type:complete len:266 (+) Transcript_17229:404-1201(+)
MTEETTNATAAAAAVESPAAVPAPETNGDTTNGPSSPSSASSPQQETAPAISKEDENGETVMANGGSTTTTTEPKAQPQKSAVTTIPTYTVAPSATTTNTPSKQKSKFVYDPEKITLRFLFANKDGLSVNVDCTFTSTVGEVKGALLSVWPEELPKCSGGSQIRLICMGKGILTPDTKTLEEFNVPTFKTHATPINVSIKPEKTDLATEKNGRSFVSNALSSATGGGSAGGALGSAGGSGSPSNTFDGSSASAGAASQGCACTIL